jgi:hypothetical protein
LISLLYRLHNTWRQTCAALFGTRRSSIMRLGLSGRGQQRHCLTKFEDMGTPVFTFSIFTFALSSCIFSDVCLFFERRSLPSTSCSVTFCWTCSLWISFIPNCWQRTITLKCLNSVFSTTPSLTISYSDTRIHLLL